VKSAGGFVSFPEPSMSGTPPDDTEHPPSSTVSITVLSVKPVKFGRIFALASVEVDIDGVLLVIHGVRAIRVQPIGTRIDLPMFRDEDGTWRHAITLPDEISGPIGRAVLDELVERGFAVRVPAP
jgi:stage V sporulation protein G